MTFSIAARCADTGMFGLAVSSSSPAVAARCSFARAGVGAVASQNITDPSLGPCILDLMAQGHSASDALAQICSSRQYIEYRQLTAVDANGQSATFSGKQTLGIFATANSDNVSCAGNLLSSNQIPDIMMAAFIDSSGALADRLLLAMREAVKAGGEAGPVHSAGLLLVDQVSWPVANLRIDWHEAGSPLNELEKLWRLYSPQLDDYLKRALDPSSAPDYGVAGESR